jgi:hypothetical protein
MNEKIIQNSMIQKKLFPIKVIQPKKKLYIYELFEKKR